MIYQEALGGNIFHINIVGGHLRHSRCVVGDGQGTWNDKTWAIEWQQRRTWRHQCKLMKRSDACQLLSVLMTCHQVYVSHRIRALRCG